ncbi:zinc ABC transporter substrate-binding protein [Glycomyces sp. L485]|uniref:metal ABC transporter solute-binding protein, Zn/Mn family n=1 Tax=Glycomyces sp. L485 TaxID=2909235 RepID=UPI001F4A26B0|nr:zinc ABC transporter substrate-binding protein [Glycomyces sp. L485]MCH7232924.1 zinc ABC transporter substrate-binding protein [Glycomyces sp. L485]
MRRTLLTVPVAGLFAATALAACGSDSSSADDGSIDIVAGFYPLAFAAEQVGGDHVDVANLTPAGQEPHDLELAPSDIAAIEEADYVIYLEGFIPELDAAIAEYASDKALEVGATVDLLGYDDTEALEDEHAEDEHAEDEHAEDEHAEDEHAEDEHAEDEGEEGHDHDEGLEGNDPHLWLDPIRYAQIGEAIADGLSGLDEANADDYAAGADDLTAELENLDQEFTEGLANRTSDDIVTSHAAFGYLADRYDLHQVAISGLSPDQEPSSQRMAEIAAFIEEHGVSTIFFETLVSSDIADTIAAETGARTAVLNPIEGLTDDDGDDADYFSIMRENLGTLQEALGAA